MMVGGVLSLLLEEASQVWSYQKMIVDNVGFELFV